MKANHHRSNVVESVQFYFLQQFLLEISPLLSSALFALFINEACLSLPFTFICFTVLLNSLILTLSFLCRQYYFALIPILVFKMYTRLISFFFSSLSLSLEILKLDTQKPFLLGVSRYLNFILMFVSSIKFYNPFINLIKTKQSLLFLSIPSTLYRPQLNISQLPPPSKLF